MESRDIDAAMGNAERILLDTSSLIAFHSPLEQVHFLAKHIMGRVESDTDPLQAYYSAVSASELLVWPIRTNVTAFTHMNAFLMRFPHLTFVPVDMVVAAQAANVRALTRIDLPDAFLIATGLVCGCEAIVSNDERWKRQL